MAEKFIMIGINDEKSKDIAEVLASKTCKKIIDFLSEIKEASENDIAKKLSMPINTAEYNLNKLIKAGLVERTKNFFWSVKGKKIEMYKLANKKIIISTKTLANNFVPVLLFLAAATFGIKFFIDNFNPKTQVSSLVNDYALEKSAGTASQVSSVQNVCSNFFSGINSEAWVWFLLGGLLVILVVLINQFKRMKGGSE